MKKILSVFLIGLLTFTSCSDDDGKEREISVPNANELNQEVYADTPTGGVTFTAKSAWEAKITETTNLKSTKADSPSWIQLSQYSGEAGIYTLTIAIDTNYTGKERSAKIEIICGNDKITITITQGGETEEGKIPEEPSPTPNKGYVSKINDTTIHYDENNKVIGLGDILYTDSDYTIKGSHLGGGGPLIYIDKGKTRYAYEVEEYVKEIRYHSDIYSSYYYLSNYSWDLAGNLILIRGDQYGVSRGGDYLRTTFEYTDIEYTLGNLDITFLLATQEYHIGTEFAAFDNNIGKRSKYLISKARQLDEGSSDKYNATRTYRYVFNEDGYITEVYCTMKYDIEPTAWDEQLIYRIEYK